MLVQVKSKIDHLTVNDRTIMKGETADCTVDRAKFLAASGLVEIVGGDDAAARAAKSTRTEHAVNLPRSQAEHQVKKG